MRNKLKKLQRAGVLVAVDITRDYYGNLDSNGDDFDIITGSETTRYEFSAEEDTLWEGCKYSDYVESIVRCFTDEGVKFSAVASDPTQAHWAESPDGIYVHPYTGVGERVTVRFDMTFCPFYKNERYAPAKAITDKLRDDIIAGVEGGR